MTVVGGCLCPQFWDSLGVALPVFSSAAAVYLGVSGLPALVTAHVLPTQE